MTRSWSASPCTARPCCTPTSLTALAFSTSPSWPARWPPPDSQGPCSAASAGRPRPRARRAARRVRGVRPPTRRRRRPHRADQRRLPVGHLRRAALARHPARHRLDPPRPLPRGHRAVGAGHPRPARVVPPRHRRLPRAPCPGARRVPGARAGRYRRPAGGPGRRPVGIGPDARRSARAAPAHGAVAGRPAVARPRRHAARSSRTPERQGRWNSATRSSPPPTSRTGSLRFPAGRATPAASPASTRSAGTPP